VAKAKATSAMTGGNVSGVWAVVPVPSRVIDGCVVEPADDEVDDPGTLVEVADEVVEDPVSPPQARTTRSAVAVAAAEWFIPDFRCRLAMNHTPRH
jgi:hypothetical protein